MAGTKRRINMKKYENVFGRLSPAQILVVGFAVLILIGTILLSLPIASSSGEPTPVIDAFFTSTSAVCVTGLVVVDTGTHYSLFGQTVILFLIQIGGLGFMTMGTLFAFLMGKRIMLRERLIMQEAYNQQTIEGVVRLAKMILAITFVIEGIAAAILALRWWPEFGLARGIFYGLFHSISAFNNAGFDLMGEYRSLTPFVSDVPVNIIITVLVIIGGIGFGVTMDVYRKRCWRKFTLHTKLVLSISAALLLLGMLLVFVLEYSNVKTLGQLSLSGKLQAAWFQAVIPRTAGFNTIDISGMRNATQFLFIIFMFIGASSGSTGGGIKTSTLGTLIAAVWAQIKGKNDAELFERRLPKEIIFRALTITMASLSLVVFVTMLLSITEKSDFLTILFEATSAFGTVGLSMGLTTKLSLWGKIIIALTMYVGRLGPITVALAVAQKQEKAVYRYAEEKIMVG